MKCLEHRPRQRYASAAELADDLGNYAAHRPVRACPSPALEPLIWSWKWVRRNAWLSAAVLLLALVAAGTAWAALRFERQATDNFHLASQNRDLADEKAGALIEALSAQARERELRLVADRRGDPGG